MATQVVPARDVAPSLVVPTEPRLPLWHAYPASDRVASQAHSVGAISMAPAGQDAVDITVSAGASADPDWSGAAWYWWPVRLVDGRLASAVPGRMGRYLLDFETLPSVSSNVQIALGLFASASVAGSPSYAIAGGDWSGARVVMAGRVLTGVYAQTLDTGGAGAFTRVLVDQGINVSAGALIASTTMAIGVSGDANPGTTPWDLVQHAGNLAYPLFIGLGVRAVGTTLATTARVRVRSSLSSAGTD